MDTNYNMVTELLRKYHLEQRRIMVYQDYNQVVDALCFKEMDDLQLRNLRDFAVIFLRSTRFDDCEDRKSVV